MSLQSHKHSKKGTTLVELVVAMTLTAIFAVACIALIHPIESIYQRTEKTVRAQLLADTVVDSIRKECDDVQYDEEYSVWIASGTFDVSSEDDTRLFTQGIDLNTGSPGQILVIKRNNNYCEAIYSCLNISDENVQAVKDNAKTGTTTGHAVSRFETDPENRKAGIVHYGYYQAKDSNKGLYPFAAYDYTNPVTASTYGDFSVMLEFKNLTYRNDNTKNAKYPAFVECTVDVYDGDIRESGVISKGPIYSRKTAICFSANGSAKGTGSDVYGGEPTHEMKDIKVTVIWDDDHNAQNKRANVSIKLNYDNDELSKSIPIDQDIYTFKFANIAASNISIEQDPVVIPGYTTTISQNSDGSFTVVNKINDVEINVKLISGPEFNSLVKAQNIVSIRFGSRRELEQFVPDYDSGYNKVSIDENENLTDDYRLFFVPEEGDPSRIRAFVISDDGTFIANEECQQMFLECTQLEIVTDINRVDTSNTTDMHKMFMDCYKLREIHVDKWNTGNVEAFDSMFRNVCIDVDDSVEMIIDLSSFSFDKCKQTVGSAGTSTAVIGINKMFCNDKKFNNKLKTSHITTIIFPAGHKDMHNVPRLQSVFQNCQNLETLSNFNDIDFSGVMDNANPQFKGIDDTMFSGCTKLTEVDLSNWNLSNLGKLQAPKFLSGLINLKNLNMSGLNLTSCSSMSSFFSSCNNLENVVLDGANFSSATNYNNFLSNKRNLVYLSMDGCILNTYVTDMAFMFSNCQKLQDLDMTVWKTQSVTTMAYMFNNCNVLQIIDVTGFDTSSVESMAYMFNGCKAVKNLDVKHFETSSVKSMERMFSDCQALESNMNLKSWDTKNVENMSYMFNNCNKLKNLDVTRFDTSSVTNMAYMFSNCYVLQKLDVTGFDTSSVKSMAYMFNGCKAIKNLDVKGFKTSNVTSMEAMFQNCNALKSIDPSGWNTSKVENMKNMFQGCKVIESFDFTGWNTSAVTTMEGMFQNCNALKGIDFTQFENWNTSNVTSMKLMFNNCCFSSTNVTVGLWTINISNFDFSKVESFSEMFNCDNGSKDLINTIILPIGDKAVSKANKVVTYRMFRNRKNLKTLDNIDQFNVTGIITDAKSTFAATGLTEIDISSLNFDNISNTADYMFNDNTYLTKIYVNPNCDYASFAQNNKDKQLFKDDKILAGPYTNWSTEKGSMARIDTQNTPGYFSVK